jgi:Uroporphyrinogen decarboxylase (URO-D)
MSCDTPNVDRLLAAFEHRKTDRVPNFEILIEDKHTSRLLGHTAGHTLGSAKGASEDEYVTPPMAAEDYIQICRLIGQDAVGMEALWAPLKRRGEDGKLHIITDGTIHAWKELDGVIPHSRELDIEPKRRHLRAYVEACKGTGIGTTIMTCAPIMTPYQFIVGFEDFMMKVLTDRDFVDKVVSMCMDYYLDIVRMACEEGVSFVYLADDIGQKGSLIMGPELSRKLAIPCYARIVQECAHYKVPVAMHSCGNAVDIIPDLIEIGIVMYNPVEPTSGADIYEVHRKYGDRICFSGNLDIAGVFRFGSPEEVAEDVRLHVDSLAQDGAYILTSSHSVTNDTPYENFLAMIAAGHRYGQYPLTRKREARADCYAQQRLDEILSHTSTERMENRAFNPETRYGLCVTCGKRAVTYIVPSGEMLCEKCYPSAGWVLVREGEGMGWHRSGAASSHW